MHYLFQSAIICKDAIAITLIEMGANVLPGPEPPARSVFYIALESGRKNIVDKVCMQFISTSLYFQLYFVCMVMHLL